MVRKAGQVSATQIVATAQDPAKPLGAYWLAVKFEDGYIYITDFASGSVLIDWLSRRRNLRGAPLKWNGTDLRRDWRAHLDTIKFWLEA